MAQVLLWGSPSHCSQQPTSQLHPAEHYKSPSVFEEKKQKPKKLKVPGAAPSSSLSCLEFTTSFDVHQYITTRCLCQEHVLVGVIHQPSKAHSKQLPTTCRGLKGPVIGIDCKIPGSKAPDLWMSYSSTQGCL